MGGGEGSWVGTTDGRREGWEVGIWVGPELEGAFVGWKDVVGAVDGGFDTAHGVPRELPSNQSCSESS